MRRHRSYYDGCRFSRPHSGNSQTASVFGVQFDVRDSNGTLASVEYDAYAEALRENIIGANEAVRGPSSIGLGVVEKADFRQGHVVNANAIQADCGVQHLLEGNQYGHLLRTALGLHVPPPIRR